MLSQIKQHFITPICHSASYIKKSHFFLRRTNGHWLVSCWKLQVLFLSRVYCAFLCIEKTFFSLCLHTEFMALYACTLNNYLLKCNLKNLYTNNGILWYIYNFNIKIFNIEKFFQLLSNSINLNSMYIHYICQTAI